MLPKIALVGRPNVGKSALFNRICQKRVSIVDEQEGITRDRIYAEADFFGRPFLLIDTGGIDVAEALPFAKQVKAQVAIAIEEADRIIFVVDGQVGVTAEDEEVAKQLKRSQKPILVAVNKIDRNGDEEKILPFRVLGIREMMGISALQGHQIAELLEITLKGIPFQEEPQIPKDPIRIAIVGRPNVGKSTLLNGLVGEERSIVSSIPGTTRDSIDLLLSQGGQDYLLIDTAGIRRKKSETEVVDKFAAIRTEEAIARSDICFLVLDSAEGFTIQERRIASAVEAQGKSCLLLFNKWDLIKNFRMEHALRDVRESVPFLSHCPALFISAAEGRNLEKILPQAKEIYENRHRRIPTGALNKFIESCLQKYHPPLITGKRLRIYYLAQVETNPPKFTLFVNRPELLIDSYKKYLINQLREAFSFSGCPILFELRGKRMRSQEDQKG